MENVIVLTSRETDKAEEGLSALRRLHDAGDIRLEAVAVVERDEEGRAIALDQADDVHVRATAAGGLIGGILGLLGGPFGLLVGGATGAVVGSLVDISEVESSDDVLHGVGRAVPPGHSSTIAVVGEEAPAAVDSLGEELGMQLTRRPRSEVELEIAEAEEELIARERDGRAKRTIGDHLRDLKDEVGEKR